MQPFERNHPAKVRLSDFADIVLDHQGLAGGAADQGASMSAVPPTVAGERPSRDFRIRPRKDIHFSLRISSRLFYTLIRDLTSR